VTSARGRRAAVASLARMTVAGHVDPTDPHLGRLGELIELAHRYRVLPTLAQVLRQSGHLPHLPQSATRALSTGPVADPAVVALLAIERAANEGHALMAALTEIRSTLESVGVATLPLKGSHLLTCGWIPDPGWRSMRDIDVLVEPAATPRATTLLAEMGFIPVSLPVLPAAHHGRPLVRSDIPGSVEIHEAVVTPRWLPVLASASFVPGGSPPSDEDVVAHLIVHALGQDDEWSTFTLPLRLLTDVSMRVAAFPERPVDWARVASHFAAAGRGAMFDAFVQLAMRFEAPWAPAARAGLGRSAFSRTRSWAYDRVAVYAGGLPEAHARFALARKRVAVLEPERLARRYGPDALRRPRLTAARYIIDWRRDHRV
jgi:hypothetical protein